MKTTQNKMSTYTCTVCIIFFSFFAGAMAAAGARSIFIVRSATEGPFELAIALFLLASSASYARRLVRLPGLSGS